MNKLISIVMGITLLCTLLSGCGSSSNTAENGELNIFIWTGYVSDAAIEEFEETYGIKVNVSTYSSNEDMLSKLKSESAGA